MCICICNYIYLLNNVPGFSQTVCSRPFKLALDRISQRTLTVLINTEKMESLENQDEVQKSNQIKSNKKRLQSLMNLKKTYQKHKSIIQLALSNTDKPTNKIVFDDDFGEVDKDFRTITKDLRKRKALFENDSDDDNFEADFSVKTHFEGKEGQKLLELQSRYKNDKRFNLDERFLDAQFNGNEMDEETSLEKEKNQQFKILNEILGKHHSKPTKQIKPESESKFMVRFDPSQPQHSKYELKKEVTQRKKNEKDKTKNVPEILEEKKSDESEIPEVSKDVFYQVKGNLRDSLLENKQVSLLSMFGKHNENGTDQRKEDEEKIIKISKPNLRNERNPFKYDSTDDEQEDISNINETQQLSGTSQHIETSNNRSNFWVEPFFFKEDDYRLQEGFDFLEKIKMEDNSEFPKSRRELKEIVKNKVRNVQQKKKPFKRKLGGNKRRKDIKLKKALKK